MTEYAKSSSWSSFLRSVSSFTGDLSTLSAPPFILSPVSLSEFPQYWGSYQDLLLRISQINKNNYKAHYPQVRSLESEDIARMFATLQWYLATLKCQFASRTEKSGFEKKPLNPFLGELFVGKWENQIKGTDKTNETILLTEQVSHHPPINAFTIFNDQENISLQGYTQIKSSFSKTLRLNVKQHGHTIIETSNDSILISFPTLHLEGILVASPYVELEDVSYIQSSTGLIWIIEYSGKGFFSGQKNSFKAKLFKDSTDMKKNKDPLYTVTGQWSGQSTISNHGKTVPFFDITKYQTDQVVVKAIEEQHHLESRKAWDDVAKAIELGDMKLISSAKTKLEEHQRKLRKEEEKMGVQWKRRWFEKVDYSKIKIKDIPESHINRKYIRLSKLAGLSVRNVQSSTMADSRDPKDVTAIHWSFNRKLWDNDKEVTV